MSEVTERMTTTEDGDGTVNERLSPGGPGPEGQPDTASESLSGSGEAEPVRVIDFDLGVDPDVDAQAVVEAPQRPRRSK